MIRFLLLSFLTFVGLYSVSAQTMLQRTLNNDTMPNLVPNPSFETTKRLQCAWTQQARKFNDEVMVGHQTVCVRAKDGIWCRGAGLYSVSR